MDSGWWSFSGRWIVCIGRSGTFGWSSVVGQLVAASGGVKSRREKEVEGLSIGRR